MTIFDYISDKNIKHKYVLERVIMHVLSLDRVSLILNYDNILSDEESILIKSMYNEYALENKPLEYILGYVEFGGLQFFVDENTIIPRPETEYMINSVRKHLSLLSKNSCIDIVDVGTGSGVLGLSLAFSHHSIVRSITLVDISQDALNIAEKNYLYHVNKKNIPSSFSLSLKIKNLLENFVFEKNVQYTIVANLPYIPDETFDTNPDKSIAFEPRVAFVGGGDGLDLYRVMFKQIFPYKENTIVMFLEMMTWQIEILEKEYEWLDFEIIATFHFQIRIVKVSIH